MNASYRYANPACSEMRKEFKEHASRQQGQGMMWNSWWWAGFAPIFHPAFDASLRQGSHLVFQQVTFQLMFKPHLRFLHRSPSKRNPRTRIRRLWTSTAMTPFTGRMQSAYFLFGEEFIMVPDTLDTRSLILGMASDVARTLGPVHQPLPLSGRSPRRNAVTQQRRRFLDFGWTLPWEQEHLLRELRNRQPECCRSSRMSGWCMLVCWNGTRLPCAYRKMAGTNPFHVLYWLWWMPSHTRMRK